MSVWQTLNAPRNKRENRVAKIARDTERERIIKLLEVWWETDQELEELVALIKGENK